MSHWSRLFVASCLFFLQAPVLWAAESCGKQVEDQSGKHTHLYVDATFDREDTQEDKSTATLWQGALAGGVSDEKVASLSALINGLIEGAPYPGHELYRDAVLFVGTHVDRLRSRVIVHLPGGLAGNTNPFWDSVRAVTKATCSCGNEREIAPGRPAIAEVWVEPARPVEFEMTVGDKVYIRPVGSDKVSTLVMFELGEEEGRAYLRPMMNPFGPANLTAVVDIFAPKVYFLDTLQPIVDKEQPCMAHQGSNSKMSFVKLLRVDASNKTIRFRLAQGAELFSPE